MAMADCEHVWKPRWDRGRTAWSCHFCQRSLDVASLLAKLRETEEKLRGATAINGCGHLKHAEWCEPRPGSTPYCTVCRSLSTISELETEVDALEAELSTLRLKLGVEVGE